MARTMARLSELQAQLVTIPITFHSYGITLAFDTTFRMAKMTPDWWSEYNQLIVTNHPDFLPQTIVDLVESWGLLGDDDQPIPLTLEALRAVPSAILIDVRDTIFEATTVKKRKTTETLGAGSRPKVA